MNSLLDSVEQVSPDIVLFGVLLEWNDSQVHQEGNRRHLMQLYLGHLRVNAQQCSQQRLQMGSSVQ